MLQAAFLAGIARASVETDWLEGFNSKTRLSAGLVETAGTKKLYAFVEVEMPEGWKTYWRNPGDAGGLPPSFSWTRSENLAKAEVLYPAPSRLTDQAGETIGYHDRVIFPVAIEAKDPAKPVVLALDMHFGICKDICVPSEAALRVEIAAGDASGPASDDAAATVARVPRKEGERRTGDPKLVRATLDVAGSKPKLVVEAKFPGGSGVDAFVDAPDGLYVPMFTRNSKDGAEIQVFEAELGPALEPSELKGKSLAITLVSDAGQSETVFKVE